ncbi:MAG TPA: glycosyltransferase 87 family protein [Mycobacterium sp.]|nr:glycosyltransferase 87 family protein [Mycobacterium sp.]
MDSWQLADPGIQQRRVIWRVCQCLVAAALGCAIWVLLGRATYRIDIDVYRMGGRAWLDGHPLYTDGALFHTAGGLDLPFTYPPLAAIAFCPFAWLPLPAAGAALTGTTLALLIVAMTLVLGGLDVWPRSEVAPGPAWLRRGWLAVAIVAPAVVLSEPIRSNFAFGQINVVLMALVIADCVPRRTPWPRGLLLGVAVALKLTPAVFLLYFLLRRDGRAALTAMASFLAATAAGFVLAWRDSWQYWTDTVRNTDRIGGATLNTNQNVAGALARLTLDDHQRSLLWLVGCLLVLAGTVWATRRVLQAGEPILALICVALFGLVVSPVSWSHHWVWMLPAVVVTGVLAYRRRAMVLGVLSAAGMALMVWSPISLLPEHQETTAPGWRQLVGVSYMWWALVVIAVAGATLTAASPARKPRKPAAAAPATVG